MKLKLYGWLMSITRMRLIIGESGGMALLDVLQACRKLEGVCFIPEEFTHSCCIETYGGEETVSFTF